MNDINIRLNQLRKALDMSQEELGNIIGIKRSGVSNIEGGTREVTQKHIKLLCVEPVKGKYVNESWLRTGEGEMFLKPKKNDLAARATALLGQQDPLFEALVESYSQLNPLNRKVLLEFSMSFLKNLERRSSEPGGFTNVDMERIWEKVSGTTEEFEEKFPPLEFPDTGKEVG